MSAGAANELLDHLAFGFNRGRTEPSAALPTWAGQGLWGVGSRVGCRESSGEVDGAGAAGGTPPALHTNSSTHAMTIRDVKRVGCKTRAWTSLGGQRVRSRQRP